MATLSVVNEFQFVCDTVSMSPDAFSEEKSNKSLLHVRSRVYHHDEHCANKTYFSKSKNNIKWLIVHK